MEAEYLRVAASNFCSIVISVFVKNHLVLVEIKENDIFQSLHLNLQLWKSTSEKVLPSELSFANCALLI